MTAEQLIECPVCGNQSFAPWIVCKDHLVSGKEFQIQSCQRCGFKATSPRPIQAEIGQYYQSSDYISHSDTREGLISQLYHYVRTFTLRQKVKLVDSLQSRPGNLLDIGCGSGYFLGVAKQAGWTVVGTEPDAQTRQVAVNRVQSQVATTIDQLQLTQPLDIITMWHVLEHVHALPDTLEWIRTNCRLNGHLVVAVPNYQSWDARHYQQHWAAYDVPRHLYHFSPDRMQALLKRYRFELTQQRPMPFDAFYVNLLSTQNRDGKPAYLESFWNGIRSNWDAYRKGGNYSSLIYIAQAH